MAANPKPLRKMAKSYTLKQPKSERKEFKKFAKSAVESGKFKDKMKKTTKLGMARKKSEANKMK